MKWLITGLSSLLTLSLASCATSDVTLKERTSDVQDNILQDIPPTGLPPQNLASNECGLFLWSKTNISQFIFFTRAGEDTALFLLDDTPTELNTVSVGGNVFGQFFTETNYQSSEGQAFSLSFIPGEGLANGARISSGGIQYKNDDGWKTVLPVLGARVCQPVIQDQVSRALPSSSE